MTLIIDDDLRAICQEIVQKYGRAGRDALVYSDDQYQRGAFCGGWDPNPDSTQGPAFYFSFYAPDGGEYIFAMTLEDVTVVAKGGAISPSLEYWKRSPFGPYQVGHGPRAGA